MMKSCKSCGNSYEGNFCNLCGERDISSKDRSLRHFFYKVLSDLTFADTKALSSFWLAISRPGRLPRLHVDGIRKRYFPPLSLFLFANLVYFFLPLFSTFNSTFHIQTNMLPHSSMAKQMTDARIAALDITREDYILEYDVRSKEYAKLLTIFFVMTLAAFLSLLYFRKDRYYTDHLYVSLEYSSLLLVLGNIGLWLLLEFFMAIGRQFHLALGHLTSDMPMSMIIAFFTIIAFYQIGRNFYDEKWLWAGVKAILVIPLLFVSLSIFRLFLFLVTYYSMV